MKQERLTRKVYSMYDDSFEYCCNKMADKFDGKELIRANQKLGQLEDIEEELGIDLVTLFKALKNGITYKTPLGNDYSYTILTSDRLSVEYKWKCLRKGTQKFYFKEYGRTWALTKEELK